MSKATRTLTPLLLGLLSMAAHGAEEETSRLDGRWKAWYTSSQSESFEMEFSGDRFHAIEGEQWYTGEVVIDAEVDPARIDFTIRECNCGFVDKTSEGIFRWDGNGIEIRAPAPGDPRPTKFDKEADETMRLVRSTKASMTNS